MQKINIGEIVNTFGLKGEVKVRSLSEFAEERFKKGKLIEILYEDTYVSLKISSMRFHQNTILLSFDGYKDINKVEKYKGCLIVMDKEKIPPLKDGFYHFQLNDLEVYYNDFLIGKVVKVDKSGGQSLLRIKTDEKEIMIPFVDAFIKKVDLENKRIDIDVIEGLL